MHLNVALELQDRIQGFGFRVQGLGLQDRIEGLGQKSWNLQAQTQVARGGGGGGGGRGGQGGREVSNSLSRRQTPKLKTLSLKP